MTTADSPFVLRKTLVLRGFMFGSFWDEYRPYSGFMPAPDGAEASNHIALFSSEKTLPFYTAPTPEAPQKYSIKIEGDKTGAELVGYGPTGLLDALAQPELAHKLEDDGGAGFNYHGLTFLANRDQPRQFEFQYCLTSPADEHSSLELTITVSEIL